MTRGFPGVTPAPPGMATDKCIINSPLKHTLTSDHKTARLASKGVFRQMAKREPDEEEKKGGLAAIRALTSAILVQCSNDAIKLGSHLRAVHYIGS